MIAIDAQHQNLVGDALCAVPYMAFLCEKHRTEAMVWNGFNRSVRELVADYPFRFTNSDQRPIGATAYCDLDIQQAWHFDLNNQWRWHMAQAYFAYYREPVPPLPCVYHMRAEPSGFPPGIVLTPFSRTNSPDNNKFWPHDRWLSVLRHLLDRGVADRAYVLGTHLDAASAYAAQPGIEVVLDRPLPQVLTMLRESPLVLGHDNGISHLCHVGGVDRHVMLYGDCLPPRFAENPLGVHVRARMPMDITVDQVLAAAARVVNAS